MADHEYAYASYETGKHLIFVNDLIICGVHLIKTFATFILI
jgi:hypothetical protein